MKSTAMEIQGEEGASSASAPPADAGDERRFLALLRGGARQLVALSRDFNLLPIRYAHASWIPEGWERAVTLFGDLGGRPEALMSARLLRHWGFADQATFAFVEPSRRIALAPPDILERTAFLAGVAVHWDPISKVLERESVLDLRRELGGEAYRFALFRAPILAGNAPAASGVAIGERGFEGLADALLRVGLDLLSACLAGAPRALRARLALKLPRERSGPILADRPGPPCPKSWRLIKGILIQEVDPSWEPLLS